ncbi:hypothetical protein [Microbacterium sp. EST19A]|uniref:hypothetical protein n=1 Tax=Microbacterium sp. EST19A TaxID=2862681 RepID=UPI001CBB05FD|nr:hypothetical protein [Microbacterium sp. EST19A]
MTQPFTTLDDVLAPILPDWTIRDLLEWLSDDTRLTDEALRDPLMIIDAALTRSRWTHEPSSVALTRSIASTVQASPRLRNMRLDDLLDVRITQMVAEPVAERPVARFEGRPQPQVA